MELAFQCQAAYGHIQEKTADMWEEEHLSPKVQEWHSLVETPFEHKESVAGLVLEKTPLDLRIAGLMAGPGVEHAAVQGLELLRKTAAVENAGKVHQLVGHQLLEEEEEALMDH